MPRSAEGDEDAILPSSTITSHAHPTAAHSDLNLDADDDDDAPPTLAFLQTLTSTTHRTSSALPKRGLKDFAPNPTDLQASTLTASRDAMNAALCHVRTHAPKNHIVGLYDEDTGLTLVKRPRGGMFGTMGRSISGGGVLLEPEEALWALERGSLDIVWPAVPPRCLHKPEEDEGEDAVDGEEEDAISLSLQAAYALFLGGPMARGLTPERYQVYAQLRRSGFVVLRAEGFEGKKPLCTSTDTVTASNNSVVKGKSGLLQWLFGFITAPRTDHDRSPEGPLVRPGLYRSYADIYRQLHLHPSPAPSSTHTSNPHETQPQHHEPNPHQTQPEEETTYEEPFTTHYNIHRPSPNFRKTHPGPPNFRVCVVDSRSTQVPSLSQVTTLMDKQPTPPAPAPPSTQPSTANRGRGLGAMYKSLRTGGRSVIIAVVDEGVISYLRFGEADFRGASAVLWEEGGGVGGGRGKGRGARGGERGGGRGGRGRGGGGRG